MLIAFVRLCNPCKSWSLVRELNYAKFSPILVLLVVDELNEHQIALELTLFFVNMIEWGVIDVFQN